MIANLYYIHLLYMGRPWSSQTMGLTFGCPTKLSTDEYTGRVRDTSEFSSRVRCE